MSLNYLRICVDQTLITSTSETYGTAQYVPINELHPWWDNLHIHKNISRSIS